MSNYFDEHGRELPDPTPIAKPVRFNRPGSTLDEIRRNLGLAQRLAEQEGLETFEEADDFDVGDDFDKTHPYQHEVDNRNDYFEQLREDFRSTDKQGAPLAGSQPTKEPVPSPSPNTTPAPTQPSETPKA